MIATALIISAHRAGSEPNGAYAMKRATNLMQDLVLMGCSPVIVQGVCAGESEISLYVPNHRDKLTGQRIRNLLQTYGQESAIEIAYGQMFLHTVGKNYPRLLGLTRYTEQKPGTPDYTYLPWEQKFLSCTQERTRLSNF